MGLDIHIHVDNPVDVFDATYYDHDDNNFKRHSLSRTFCDLMSRRDLIEGEPELDQIARMAGTDISPLYDMNNYGDESEIQFRLEYAKSDIEREEILQKVEARRSALRGNIDKVSVLITQLIEKLSTVADIPALLLPDENEEDILNRNFYFSDFNTDLGDGYIDNNLGHDLRNFKRFLEYAKERGTKTVYFVYG
ncbi:hypothetical protein ABDD95_08650 [Mucilaginibacter sp. PAMB04274]|uniref:hypothetical protein n=1 Tax=Mucilaginibacter sp. PAMB04274 TaxID=3138568 RepID=UPI0031F62904